jgi:hypothetical protein
MARASRPPGFDMTYRPAEEFFGPPLRARVPSFLHAALGAGVIVLVLLVERAPGSELYDYMYRQPHLIDAHLLAAAFAVSSLASLLRAGMRGVRVRPDWLEYRDVLGSLWPKVQRYRWAQIEGMHFHESGAIQLALWDGTSELLPPVADRDGLARALELLGRARAIPMRGAPELDELDTEEPLGEE